MLTSQQLVKVLKGAGIAGVGASLTYLTEWVTVVDFGGWTPIAVAGFSVLVNVIRKLMSSE